jgi:membrane-associated phospholipid phosphatase
VPTRARADPTQTLISSVDVTAARSAKSGSAEQVRSRLSLLMAVVAGSMVVFAVNYGFFVRTTLGQELDNAALVGGEHEPQGVISEAWDLLDIISVASLALACVVIGVVALLRKRFALAFAALAAIGLANVTTQLLKRVVLERPDLIGAGDLNSLPSGHATVAASVAVGLVMVTAPRWRSTVALVSVLFAIAVAVAVVTAAWHRPSDSIAAFCVVLGVAAASLSVVVAVFGFDAGERPPQWFRRSALVLVGAATVLLGGLGILGLWAVRDRLSDGPLGPRWESVAYASSTAGIAAAALVVMLCLVLALRGIAVGHGGRTRPDDTEA